VLDKLRRHIRILVDIGRLSGENADLDRFLDQTVLHIARGVEIHHVKILQYRPETSDLLLVAGVGWKEGVVRTATFSVDLRSPPGRAFQTAEPVSIKNFSDQEEYVRSNFLKEHGIVSVSNVPVRIGGAAWGVLEVDSTTPRDFTEDYHRISHRRCRSDCNRAAPKCTAGRTSTIDGCRCRSSKRRDFASRNATSCQEQLSAGSILYLHSKTSVPRR
jgi:transcriptional regulator with GAF, ATPase, and Fis domain